MLMFRDRTEEVRRLTRRIRRVLAYRHAMHIGELRIRVGEEGDALRAILEEMMARGEIERMRPIGYPGEDHDFFRLKALEVWRFDLATDAFETASLSRHARRVSRDSNMKFTMD